MIERQLKNIFINLEDLFLKFDVVGNKNLKQIFYKITTVFTIDKLLTIYRQFRPPPLGYYPFVGLFNNGNLKTFLFKVNSKIVLTYCSEFCGSSTLPKIVSWAKDKAYQLGLAK